MHVAPRCIAALVPALLLAGAVAAQDWDGDGVPDLTDNCVNVPNGGAQGGQADRDGDGIGDACECGDASGDGRVNTTDARLIQLCSVGIIPCPARCDVTGEDVCNTTDARLIQRLAVQELTKASLRCVERCEAPGCPVCGDGRCDVGERCGSLRPSCGEDCGACEVGMACPGGDPDCVTGSICELGACAVPFSKPLGAPCGRPDACQSGLCDAMDLVCIAPGSKADGEPCSVPEECASASCVDGFCGAGCGDDSRRPLGCFCAQDKECASKRCEFMRCVPLDCAGGFDPCQTDDDCCATAYGGPLRCTDRGAAGLLCLP